MIVKHRIFFLILLIFTLSSFFIVKDAQTLPSIQWNHVYAEEDFVGVDGLIKFVKELHTGAPLYLSIMELILYNLNLDIVFVNNIIYRMALFLTFLLPLILLYNFRVPNIKMIIVVAIVSFVFLWGTVVIHVCNPSLYDILTPLFFLLYILFVKLILNKNKYQWIYSLLAGFFLAQAEMVRPYILIILPFLIIVNYFQFNSLKTFISFIIPIILFSGLWHLKLFLVNNGQIFWSNHGGCSASRFWHYPIIPPQLKPEIGPLKPNRWVNYNTYKHTLNCMEHSRRIKEFMLAKPFKTAHLIMRRYGYYFKPQMSMYSCIPNHKILIFYKYFNNLLFLFFIMSIIYMIYYLYKDKMKFFLKLDMLILISIHFFMFIIAIGDAGEESRYYISILPILMLMPFLLMKDFKFKRNKI